MVQTRAKSKKSAEIISSNDDLLTEILVRLPVTSILRFKSVSKHWHSLLTHTHFTQRYDNISKSPSPGPDVDLYQIQIYSSDARKWKIAIQSFPASSIFPARPGVYWNGAVYWAPFPDNSNFLYFKMDSEQLQTLPLPVGFICSYFGESRGHLHLIAYNIHQENRLRLNLYEMLSHHSRWFVKYQVQLDALPMLSQI
ncbi:putative F-box domain-containing protein [Helianthus annuus]|nr:putative F-box domain-containing protein [Helianthus annuus]